MSLVKCYAMYGLVGGPFPYGFYYSAGLDTLGQKLKEIGPKPNDTRVVIYGHSMGANQCTAVAAAVRKRSIDLIAAFDPTAWYPCRQIGANVRHVIWFRGTSILSPAGHGILRVNTKFSGRFDRYDVRQRHEKIDDKPELHKIVIEAVRGL